VTWAVRVRTVWSAWDRAPFNSLNNYIHSLTLAEQAALSLRAAALEPVTRVLSTFPPQFEFQMH
jgi:hypothetical protein